MWIVSTLVIVSFYCVWRGRGGSAIFYIDWVGILCCKVVHSIGSNKDVTVSNTAYKYVMLLWVTLHIKWCHSDTRQSTMSVEFNYKLFSMQGKHQQQQYDQQHISRWRWDCDKSSYRLGNTKKTKLQYNFGIITTWDNMHVKSALSMHLLRGILI